MEGSERSAEGRGKTRSSNAWESILFGGSVDAERGDGRTYSSRMSRICCASVGRMGTSAAKGRFWSFVVLRTSSSVSGGFSSFMGRGCFGGG